jgi:hypothetical protein
VEIISKHNGDYSVLLFSLHDNITIVLVRTRWLQVVLILSADGSVNNIYYTG